MGFQDKREIKNAIDTALSDINLDDLIQISSNVDDVTPSAGNFDGGSGLSGTDDFYNGLLLVFSSGVLTGIARSISDYTGASKNIILANPFPTVPADGDNFSIIGLELTAAGGDATIANQTLMKDGGDADWVNTDSLHDIKAEVENLPADLARVQSSRDFWSVTVPTVTITGGSTTIGITPPVVIPSGAHGIPDGATIDCVHLMPKWREIRDTSESVNYINNASMAIQVDDSIDTGWLTGYLFGNNSLYIDPAISVLGGGDMDDSITDVSARVNAAGTYDIQIINAQALGSNLLLRDFKWALRVWWH